MENVHQVKAVPIIAGIILAGGEGKRVGGANKGLLPFRGKALVLHVLDRLKPQLAALIISANRDADIFRSFGFPVFPDHDSWLGMGPLAGLASCYPHLPRAIDALLIAPCDTPFIPENIVEKLAEKLFENPENKIAYAATKTCIHPSIFLCRPEINETLAAHINGNQRSLRSWIFRHRAIEVLFDDDCAFTNINHAETLENFG